MARRTVFAWASLLLLALAGAPVRAEDPPTEPAAPALEVNRARALMQEGKNLFRQRRPLEAAERMERAIEIFRRHRDDTEELAGCLAWLGLVLNEAARPQRARPVNEEALERFRRLFPGDHFAVARGRINLAISLGALGRHAEALPLKTEALAMYRRLHPGDHRFVATCLGNLAYTLGQLGRHAEALPLEEEALAMRRRLSPGDHPDVALSLTNLSHSLDAVGRTAEALPRAAEALAMWRRLFPGDHPAVARGLNGLGFIYDGLGRHAEALPLFEEALEMRRRLFSRDHPELATSLANLACTYEDLGRPAEALPLKREAFTMWRRLFPGDHPGVAVSMGDLAYTYLALDRPADALPLFRETLEMMQRLHAGDHPNVARGLNHLAITCLRLGQEERALSLHQKALAMRRRLFSGDHPDVAASLGNLAKAYFVVGRLSDALTHARQAAEMAERTGWSERQMPLGLLGQLLLARGRPEEAVPLLRQSVRHLESLRSRAKGLGPARRAGYVATARRWDPHPPLIEALVTLGRPDEALGVLERGRAREMLDLLERSRIDPLERAVARARREDDEEALDLLANVRQAVAESETEVTLREREERRVREVGELRAIRDAARETARARRALLEALERQNRAIRDVLPDASPRTPEEIQDLLAPDERMLLFGLGPCSSYAILVSSEPRRVRAFPLREGDRALTSARLSAWIPEYVRTLDHPPTEDETAPSSTALFEALVPEEVWREIRGVRRVYLVGHGILHALPFEALVVGEREDRPVYWLDDGPPIAYVASGSVLAWLRTRRDARRATETDLSLVALGDPVFAGARPPPTWPERGVLVRDVRPGGQAAALGLRPGDVLTRYGEREIVDLPSLRDAIQGGKDATSVSVRVRRGDREIAVEAKPGPLGVEVAREPPPVAGTNLLRRGPLAVAVRSALERGKALPALPGTRDEVEGVVRTFLEEGPAEARVDVLLGDEATETRLHEIVTGARYLHLATHGIVDETETASFSALALTMPAVPVPGDDGFLTLADLLGRWQSRLERTEMVVLSACDTQRGRIRNDEGVLALPWGFHFAGCPTIVGTLWQVADESTPRLMEEMYRRILRTGGEDKLDALVRAKRSLRATRPHPFYWAPFVLLGDPR